MANFQQLVFLHVQYPEEIFVAVFALKKKTIYALKKNIYAGSSISGFGWMVLILI
jgi:hypothetical protein